MRRCLSHRLSGASQDRRQSRPQTRTNFIQHLDGGLATEIYAKEGDFVCAGEPLVRLDGRDIAEELKGTEAELAAKKSQLDIDKNSMFGCEGR